MRASVLHALRLACVLVACSVATQARPSSAESGIADPTLSTLTCEQGDCQQVASVLFCPAGDGSDALSPIVVGILLRDGLGNPVLVYPFQDLWIDGESLVDPVLRACPGTTMADANTNGSGFTTITLDAWHFSGAGAPTHLRVYVSGVPFAAEIFTLTAASPDIDRDGRVDLVDLRLFADDLFGLGSPADRARSDFDFDGALGIADVAIFARHYGHECPF